MLVIKCMKDLNQEGITKPKNSKAKTPRSNYQTPKEKPADKEVSL